jgi:hypothetical protein
LEDDGNARRGACAGHHHGDFPLGRPGGGRQGKSSQSRAGGRDVTAVRGRVAWGMQKLLPREVVDDYDDGDDDDDDDNYATWLSEVEGVQGASKQYGVGWHGRRRGCSYLAAYPTHTSVHTHMYACLDRVWRWMDGWMDGTTRVHLGGGFHVRHPAGSTRLCHDNQRLGTRKSALVSRMMMPPQRRRRRRPWGKGRQGRGGGSLEGSVGKDSDSPVIIQNQKQLPPPGRVGRVNSTTALRLGQPSEQ